MSEISPLEEWTSRSFAWSYDWEKTCFVDTIFMGFQFETYDSTFFHQDSLRELNSSGSKASIVCNGMHIWNDTGYLPSWEKLRK